MQALAIALAGLAASMIFTYYLYARIMSPLFKIYAMLTSFFISMIIAVAYIFSNSEVRTAISQILSNLFAQADLRTSVLTSSIMILGLLIQFGLWYLFITLGNKQMVKALEAKK